MRNVFILILFSWSGTAVGQLQSRIYTDYYGPFSQTSSAVKGKPRHITSETVLSIQRVNEKRDTLKNRVVVEWECNEKGEAVLRRSFINGKPYDETIYSPRPGLYGLSYKVYEFQQNKKRIKLEVNSSRMSKETYITTVQSYSWPIQGISTKVDTALRFLTIYVYGQDSETGVTTEAVAQYEGEAGGLSLMTTNRYDRLGRLLTTRQLYDSVARDYYYPAYDGKSPNDTWHMLPDSLTEYSYKKGSLSYRTLIYIRNQFHDAETILEYVGERGKWHTLNRTITNQYRYDKRGNWIYWEMEEKMKNEWYDNQSRSIIKRKIVY